MRNPSLPDWARRGLVPALFLVALYGALHQRTWSVDGCLHTIDSDHFIDDRTYPHFLFRPVTYLWVSACKQAGLVTRAQWYDALRLLFVGFGVIALTVLFGVACRRGGEAAAWVCLVTVAFARNAMRHLTVLDEKPLGMILFALAVLSTDRLFRRVESGPHHTPAFATVLPAATAWTIALFGHLQNAPFAAAFLAALALFLPPRGTPVSRRAGLAGLAGLHMALVASVLFVALHWQMGRLAALPAFLHTLFLQRPAPPPAPNLVSLWLGALEGWTKAFFIVDRSSPGILVGLSVVGFVILAVAAAFGVARRGDALARMLLSGGLFQMVLMPLANSFPGFGDSYTVLILAAFVLLATAPWRLLLAGAALVLVVNLPAVLPLAHPRLTMQRHLAAMIEIQRARNAPWIILDELAGLSGEQGLTPVYYSMEADLRYRRSSFETLPPETFLVDLPIIIRRDGSVDTTRLVSIQGEFERRGRRAIRARLWDPPRTIGAEFRSYGHYLIVDAARP